MREKMPVSKRLLAVWYRLRQKRGHPRFSEERLRRLSVLYPEQMPEAAAERQDERLVRQLMLGMAALCLLAVLLIWMQSGTAASIHRLRRPEPGENSQWTEFTVEADTQFWETGMEIHERERTEQEQEEILDQAEEIMIGQLIGDNSSLEQVCLPLDFSAPCPLEGVAVFWIPCEPSLIHWDGSLTTEVVFGQGRQTFVELQLDYEGRQRIKRIPVTLVDREPEEKSWEEQVQAALSAAEKRLPEQEYVELPNEIGGMSVSYRTASCSNAGWLVFLGIVALAVLPLRQEQKIREGLRLREEELALSYSELAAKLKVMVGAGLTVRGAWERMVTDYEKEREKGGARRILYEEMRRTWHSLSQGTMEEQAYAEFGRRCGLAAYLRLGGLLESHLKNGTKGIGAILSAESAEAFRERLTLARRQGEQISARLLLPLMLLFGLVLAMLVLPAFLAI